MSRLSEHRVAAGPASHTASAAPHAPASLNTPHHHHHQQQQQQQQPTCPVCSPLLPRAAIANGMAWYGTVNVDLYSAIITKVSNAPNPNPYPNTSPNLRYDRLAIAHLGYNGPRLQRADTLVCPVVGYTTRVPRSTGPGHNLCIVALQMTNVPLVPLELTVRVRVGWKSALFLTLNVSGREPWTSRHVDKNRNNSSSSSSSGDGEYWP